LRQADQARTDFAIIEDELEAIHKRLSLLPTRNEVWRAAMLGMLGGAVAAVTLIGAFARACIKPGKSQSPASDQQIDDEYDQQNTADTDTAAISPPAIAETAPEE
jgi:hypothetical protein